MIVPFIINDETGKVLETPHYEETLPDGTKIGVQEVNGVKRYMSFKPTEAGRKCMAAAPKYADNFPVYPRSEWSARIKEKKERKSRIENYQNFAAHDQNGFPSCWRNGPAHAATTRRVIDGLPLVYIGAMSLCPEHSPNTGGDEFDAGEYLVSDGGASFEVWGNNDSNMRLTNTPAVQESRKHHKLSKLYSMESFDDWMSAFLLPLPMPGAMAFNRWSHVISGGDADEDGGAFGLLLRNNWGEDYGKKNAYGFGGYNLFMEGGWTPSSGFVIGPMTLSQV